jgi:peptidoglycan/LPS O-acetylase OafA/YrhL
MMFHGGIPHMDGGFMGVDAFFVLSGFLITSLLLGEWRQALTIKLGAFWARRARRLLPALLLMLLFVAFFASVIVPKGTYGALRLDALATLLYVSNWHFILVNSNYFNETSASSPLLHTWSLAVEEQFYVIWPLVVLAVMHFTRSLRALFALCCAAAIASALWMHRVYDGGVNTNRAYLGTSVARWPWDSCSSRSDGTKQDGWPRGSCGGRRARPGCSSVACWASSGQRAPSRCGC